MDDLPYMFKPSIPQERMQAQAGAFLFWRTMRSGLLDRQLIPARINGSATNDILGQLQAFGIRKEILFPNVEDAA